MKIKVAIIVRSLEKGGTERQVIEIASGLDQEKFKVVIISFYNKGELIELARKKNIEVIFIGKKNRYDLILFLYKFITCTHKVKPDIIHSFLDSPNIFSSIYKLLYPNSILLWGIRSSDMDLTKYTKMRTFSKFIEVSLSKFPNEIIFNSLNAIRNNDNSRYKSKYSVIQNGIDTKIFINSEVLRNQYRNKWALDESFFIIGMVARFDPKKDHKNFIKASKIILKNRENIRFVLITNYKKELESIINSYGMKKYFIIETNITETNKIYPAFDINTLSSAFGEGFPNAIAEGMSCGIPSTATDTGDSKEIIGDIKLISKPRDPAELASCWISIYEKNFEERIKIGLEQRNRIINNYSKEIMLKKSEKLYFKYHQLNNNE
ncbi:MAG: hypothetical protein CFH01_00546 [Alphaproteobacteria bacterium MarineAlpha2_Bin1]|nr:MAG: hypothetical protein CFH01_00546 [Alphaproteobacteria bacterium MarineAlpha2_Bin1]